MSSRKAAKAAVRKPENPNAVPIVGRPGDDPQELIAEAMMRPSSHAAVSIHSINNGTEGLTVMALVGELHKQAAAVQSNDLGRLEAMLAMQAHTLDALFGRLTRSALASDQLHQYEVKFKLALRAQSQCRATIETLAAIKNPQPTAFIRQQNIAANQQVNNGMASAPRAEENGSSPNKVLEHEHVERMDIGAAGKAGPSHWTLEAVGAVNGAANGGG